MKVIIQTPDVNAKQSLLDFVDEKVQKLGQFSERVIDARVTLRTDKSDNRENKICEIRVGIPGNDLFVSKQAASFEEATLDAVDAMKRQINDWKNMTRPVAR